MAVAIEGWARRCQARLTLTKPVVSACFKHEQCGLETLYGSKELAAPWHWLCKIVGNGIFHWIWEGRHAGAWRP